MSIDIDLVLDVGAVVGEGPVWDELEQILWWIDILGERLHRYDPAADENTVVELGTVPGAAALGTSGELLLAVQSGLVSFDPDSATCTVIAEIEADDPTTRMNDGNVDRHGRFWVGSMAFDATLGRGSLYRVDPDLSVTPVLGEVTISNGIDWSIDGRTMYYIDSADGTVDTLDFDVRAGTVGKRRPLIEIDPDLGVPDGMTVDGEGNLWVAVFGGGCVRCYGPDGSLLEVVSLPALQVTACAFAGPELTELYVTTAAYGLDEQARGEQPGAGGLFLCQPGVRGLVPNRFGD